MTRGDHPARPAVAGVARGGRNGGDADAARRRCPPRVRRGRRGDARAAVPSRPGRRGHGCGPRPRPDHRADHRGGPVSAYRRAASPATAGSPMSPTPVRRCASSTAAPGPSITATTSTTTGPPPRDVGAVTGTYDAAATRRDQRCPAPASRITLFDRARWRRARSQPDGHRRGSRPALPYRGHLLVAPARSPSPGSNGPAPCVDAPAGAAQVRP